MKPLLSICLFLTALVLLPTKSAAWDVPKSAPFHTEETENVIAEAAKVANNEPVGIWSFPEEDSDVAIIPASDSETGIYKIVLLYDADLLPPPGTVIGYLSPTASRTKWRAWLYTTAKNNEMRSPREFTATFSFSTQTEDASLILEKAKGGLSLRVHPLALIPFLRRIVSVNMSKSGDGKIPYGLHRKDTTHRLRWL